MDPALRELLKGDGDDEVPAIVRLAPGAPPPPGVRLVATLGDVATCRLPRARIAEVWSHDSVVSLKAARPFGVDPHELAEVEEEPLAEPSDRRRPEGLEPTGRGVVVAAVDWGFDFAHPNFRNQDGSTRALALWDQTASGPSPEPYGYGRVFTRGDIDQALRADQPYVALGYHPASGDAVGRGAHGTHVLDIAAGNGRVSGSPAGMAPEADLLFVHLATPGTGGRASLGDSVTLLEALDWLARASQGKLLAVNCSVGRHGGPHHGLTLVERAIDAFVAERPGRCVVQSTGNYYRANVHASGTLRPGQRRTLRWVTDRADRTPNELEIWYSGRDTLVVEIAHPEGGEPVRAALGEQTAIVKEGREIGRVYHRAHDPSNGDHHLDLFLYPQAPAGAWRVTLIAEDVVDGRFHAWVERDAACAGCQSRLDPEDADPHSTIGTIANGFRSIVVGAYDAHAAERPLAPFSSSGPTRDGRVKPDLVAPGVAVLAARSASRDLGEEMPPLTRYSGTSMAAPHVTGTVALMFEVAARPLAIQDTRRLLLASARPLEVAADDGERVGSGCLDVERAVEAARRAAAGGIPLPGPSRPAVAVAAPARENTTPRPPATETPLFARPAPKEEPEEDTMPERSHPRLPSRHHTRAHEASRGDAGSSRMLHELLATAGAAGIGLEGAPVSPAGLFDALVTSSALRARLGEHLEVVALPGQAPFSPPQAGDLLVQRALGEGGLGSAAVLAPSDPWDSEELAEVGLASRGTLPGTYFEIDESDPPGQLPARQVLDAAGRLPFDRLLLRPRTRGAEALPLEAGPEKQFRSPRFQGDPVLADVLNGRRLLRPGSRGEAVRKMQQALLDLGYPLPRFGADGDYGSETAGAVRRFQTDQRRTDSTVLVDAIVGPQTMDKLDLAFAVPVAAPVRERRNVTALSATELAALAAAINELKRRRIYHEFVRDHANSMQNAHRQSAFLPWHRQFILHFESELRAIDPSVTLPYWDWANDPGVDAAGNPTWNATMVTLLGGNGTGANDAVTTGPLAGWTAVGAAGNDTSMPLQRSFGSASWARTLPRMTEVTAALAVTPYDESPWDEASTTGGFRNELEGWRGTNSLHNVIHGWVGGSMLPPTSPNDPCFFLHHCFVDKIWADWQAAHPGLSYLPTTTQTRAGSPTPAWGLNDDVPVTRVTTASPVTFKPAETLDLNNLKDHKGATGIRVRYV